MTAVAYDSRRSLLPRFAGEMETEYQVSYYEKIRPTLRTAALLLALLFLAFVGRDYSDTQSVALAVRANGCPAGFCFLLFVCTYWKGFGRYWQPFVLAGGWAASVYSLDGLATYYAGVPDLALGPFRLDHLLFAYHMSILAVCLAVFRLPFTASLWLQGGVLFLGIWAFWTRMLRDGPDPIDTLCRFIQPALLVTFGILLVAYFQEKMARGAFAATWMLDEMCEEEHARRVETERMLRVLAQAIGGVVHDLGTPLTWVQGGADYLRDLAREGEASPEAVEEFAGIIHRGAGMLNFLRLSLIEQTRVLEGRPTPLDVSVVAVRGVVEAGLSCQKPSALTNREVHIDGDELCLCGDEMKLTTVFMNLIGNALKYSRGEIRVTWRRCAETLLVGVLDCGTDDRGITQAQAAQLFTPFGRLADHGTIEGTGLGLLSVRKIVEAHGGEVFIEGYVDGGPASAWFSTARQGYAAMLEAPYRTAFVVALPVVSVL